MNCTYLMPIRRSVLNEVEAEALHSYLKRIQPAVSEVIVVDGSPDHVFDAHDAVWSEICRHQRVDRQFGFLNDKVNGIHTGVRLASNDNIILADDDIRYTSDDIEQITRLLDRFEVVRPQNYFAFGNVASAAGRCADGSDRQDAHAAQTIPAKMEAARMLINRATLATADYPGTCAFRRQTWLTAGAYDGDVLFDNEELIRHFARRGAQICYANDFFIPKRPPIFRKWLEQRPRQAYEDFGLRAKTVLFALLPLLIIGSLIFVNIQLALVIAATVAFIAVGLAVRGRVRGTARRFFPFQVCLFAPLWIFERSVSTYWAFYWFLRRGGYPFGGRLLQKGIGRDWVEGGKVAAQTVSGSTLRK